MEADMGVLMLVCSTTGREFSTGIHIDIESFRNLPATALSSSCPCCGTVHAWTPREARFAERPCGPEHVLGPE
jgi:hypothetical protein